MTAWGDKLLADKLANAFDEEFLIEANKGKDRQDWRLNHRIMQRVFMADEEQTLKELAEHLSPTGAQNKTVDYD